jgi:NAD(P)H dehydrogenase (quinone)
VIGVTPDHYGTEQALERSSLGYTFLRNNLYADLLPSALGHAVATGKLFRAAANGAVAYVTREDCARVAAATLGSSFEGRRIVEISGPAAVTFDEIARIASELTGKSIEYVPILRPAFEEALRSAGLPPFVASLYASFDEGAAKGELDLVTHSVEELTGKPPESVGSFLARNKAALLAPPAH